MTESVVFSRLSGVTVSDVQQDIMCDRVSCIQHAVRCDSQLYSAGCQV